jgi:DNA primase
MNNATLHRRTLVKDSLPTPLHYLTKRDLLKQSPRGEWAVITCPSHKGGAEKTPSLSVSLVDGHFRCFACGAAGGDVVALHRLITGQKFVDAVRDLGGRFD